MAPVRRILEAGSGVWRYLTARSLHRTQIALEQERTRATEMVLEKLPHGADFLDIAPGGRMTAIRFPGQSDGEGHTQAAAELWP